MFGFIAPPCPRCTRESLPAWRGAFCGLARCLGRDYGQPARLLVNRDATFLALIGLSLDPAAPTWKHATCCNPFTTPFPVADDHPAVLHAAAVSVCGLATKLVDDAHDEGLVRRSISKLGALLTSAATDRAVAQLNSTGFATAPVINLLQAQPAIESSRPDQADMPTAEAFGHICSHLATLLDRPALRDSLHRTGAALGSLIYWRDAWDDRATDAKRGRFNPFERLERAVIRDRIAAAWADFHASLTALPFIRHSELIVSLHSATAQRHAPFLQLSTTADESKRREKRREKDRDHHWWQSCDCSGCCDPCSCCPVPSRGGCCDAACDCGPGDSGCCDCNPCDGCDCCPCH